MVITDTIYLLMYHRLSQVVYIALFLQLTSNRRHTETNNVIDQLPLNITTKENITVNIFYRKDNFLICLNIYISLCSILVSLKDESCEINQGDYIRDFINMHSFITCIKDKLPIEAKGSYNH